MVVYLVGGLCMGIMVAPVVEKVIKDYVEKFVK